MNPFARKPRKRTELEVTRDEAIAELRVLTAEDPAYAKIMAHVQTLSNLILAEKPERLSPNTLAVVLGNAGIAVLVVGYEHGNVITTKVQSFLSKAK